MNLKGLIHRELGEGMTEKELASAIGPYERSKIFLPINSPKTLPDGKNL